MQEYIVRDISLAEEGSKKIEWAEAHMPALLEVRKVFSKEIPLKGMRISCCLHVTKETAVLVETLKRGGAEVALCASNPLSTQDDVSAALAMKGILVYAKRGVSNEEYYECLNRCLDLKPTITMDDGADLLNAIHFKRSDLLNNVLGGLEETTTGVIRLRAMSRDGMLKYPVIAVNNAKTKNMFDNRYGTGQSTMDGILRSTNMLVAGRNVVVAGYGWCGKGVSSRARGMGANVIVTEVDEVKALEAVMDGFKVMEMNEAARIGDLFITVTGNKDVISTPHFALMKDGAVLANSGHFDVEINVKELEKQSKSKKTLRDNLQEFTFKDGKKIYLVAEGRLVNLSSAEGHPSEVMQMSFSDQALCAEYIAKNHSKLEKRVYDVPDEIDRKVAGLALKSSGVKIDSLTAEQEKYLESWNEGT